MSEIVVTDELTGIDFAASAEKEILQNVRTILATTGFSCPMIRDFAWNPDVDAPISVVQATLAGRIVAAIREYEPRAEVVRVTFEGDGLTGKLKPIVVVRISDDAEI